MLEFGKIASGAGSNVVGRATSDVVVGAEFADQIFDAVDGLCQSKSA